MNPFKELDLQKYSRPPIRRESKKYTMNATTTTHQEVNNRSYRKLPYQCTTGGSFKENYEGNINTKSTKNIQFNLRDSTVQNNGSSFLGKSQVSKSMTSSVYAPKEKEQKSKSRWEATEYYQNKNEDPDPIIPRQIPLNSTVSGLKNKFSDSSKYMKSYTQYSSVNLPNNGSEYLDYSQYNHYLPTKYDTPRGNDTLKTKNDYSAYELGGSKKDLQAKSSRKYEKIRSVNISAPMKNQEQNYMSSTFDYNISISTVESRSNFLHQSGGGRKYKDSYENYTERKTTDYLESRSKSTLSTQKLEKFEKKLSFKEEVPKQPELDDFIIGQCKGEGRFGKVYMAIHKKTGFLCALKKVKKESVRFMMDQFIQQIKIQLFLNFPKLVKIYGYFSDAEHFYMLIEYMEDGSLYSLMKKNKKFQEAQAIEKLNQICEGIKEMHDNSIVHRDLKPQNVVMSHGVCKICDFGWAAICQDRRQTYCGTLDYVCPEIIQGNPYDSSVDIWCIGVLAYELMTGKAPFYDISRKKTMQKIKSCKIQNYPSHFSKQAIKFIEMILTKDPNSRVGIQELLDSQFLKSKKKE